MDGVVGLSLLVGVTGFASSGARNGNSPFWLGAAGGLAVGVITTGGGAKRGGIGSGNDGISTGAFGASRSGAGVAAAGIGFVVASGR